MSPFDSNSASYYNNLVNQPHASFISLSHLLSICELHMISTMEPTRDPGRVRVNGRRNKRFGRPLISAPRPLIRVWSTQSFSPPSHPFSSPFKRAGATFLVSGMPLGSTIPTYFVPFQRGGDASKPRMFHPFLTFVANLKARFGRTYVVPVTKSGFFFRFRGDVLAMESCLRAVDSCRCSWVAFWALGVVGCTISGTWGRSGRAESWVVSSRGWVCAKPPP